MGKRAHFRSLRQELADKGQELRDKGWRPVEPSCLVIVLLFLKGKGLDIAGYPKVFASPNLASSGIEYFQDLKVKSPIFYCLYYNAYKIVNKFSKVLSLSEDDNKIRQKSLGYAFAVIFGVADKEQFEAMSRVQKKDIVHSVKFIIRKRANHIVACRNLMER